MKLLNKSILSFMIFVGMSLPWQVLRTFRFLIILRTSFSFVVLKVKVELNSLCLILKTLGWFWNEELRWFITLNLKRNQLVISKLTWRIWQILTRALESLKNSHFNGFLLSKVHIVWTKKVQRSYLSWNWRGMENLERNQLVVSKLT